MGRIFGFVCLVLSLPVWAGPALTTYKQFGGPGTSIAGMALDPAGNIYIVGTTTEQIPLLNPIQSKLGGGNCAMTSTAYTPCPDVFVAKFDPTGTMLIYSTYLGASQQNFAAGIAVDGAGNAYVAGTVVPAPPGLSPLSRYRGNAFLYKINPSGSAIAWSRTINSFSSASSVAVDSYGNAYVAGTSYALDFPALNALQPSPPYKPIYVSNDAGASWHLLTTRLPVLTVYSLAFGQGAVYAATSSGLFRSGDAGITWARILAQAAVAREVITDPRSSSVYVTYGDASGFISQFAKSSDAGATWTDLTPAAAIVGPQQFGALAMDPSNAAILWLAGISPGSPEIYKSTDGGAHWHDVHDFPTFATPSQDSLSSDPDQSGIAFDPGNSSRVYVCCATRMFNNIPAIFRTDDGGATWTEGGTAPIGSNQGISPPALDPRNPATLWATWFGGLVRSTDGGQTWSKAALPADAPVQGYSASPAFDPAGVLYVVNDYGVMLRSTDSGASWTTATGPWASGAGLLAIDPAHLTTIYISSPGYAFVQHAFAAKFDSSGNAVWATLLAGTEQDSANAVAVDAAGNAYVAGTTNSPDFPAANALQPERGKAALSGYDAFIAKIAADGSKLLYSTYLGGSGDDSANAIAVDSAGSAYVAGSTNLSDFPTVNAIQSKPPSPAGASFVARIDPTGQKLIYATYLGGSVNSPSLDGARAIAVDSTGAAWVAGTTGTADFPLVNPIQPSTTGQSGYVAKISPAGDSLQFSTYLNFANVASGFVGLSYAAVAVVPASPQTTWVAGGIGISPFARLDVSPQVQPGVPAILSVYNAGSYQLGDIVAPGEVVSIFGNDLADGTEAAGGYPLPQALQGTTVAIGSVVAPLYFVSPTQINFMVPTVLPPGTTDLAVIRGNQTSAIRKLAIVSAASGIFTTDGTGASPLLVHAADFSLVTAQNPAHPGEYLALYCTGLGDTSRTNNLPMLTLNSHDVKPSYAGPAPGYAGVYQINFQLPANTLPGTAVLQATYAGSSLVVFPFSNLVYFPVR